ncbi:hypothetical protein QF029_000924 [Priestia megaterium]|nr:hypothetical protein [Priestia megaterium]
MKKRTKTLSAIITGAAILIGNMANKRKPLSQRSSF